MNEQINEQPMTQTDPRREMFHAVVRFMAPNEGLVSIYAKDAEHAKLILGAQFMSRQGFEVVDIYPASEIKDAGAPAEDVTAEVIAPQDTPVGEEKVELSNGQ